MTVNPSGWRPSTPANEQGEASTVTGNRALMLEEPLLFEIGSIDQTGIVAQRGPAAARSRYTPGSTVCRTVYSVTWPSPLPAPGKSGTAIRAR